MKQWLSDRWLLLAVVVAYAALKTPVLSYPFFWDESWSYAPGVKLMYQHGPSLMPDAIDQFYSRGHPLLFYALSAAWMKLFGTSHVAQHSLMLIIAILLLVAVYEVCLRLFNKRTAVIALLLLATQEILFVQSTMLLPEVLVALLSMLSIYYYCREKYLATFVSLSALLLTKESGMAIGLTLGVCAALSLLGKENTASKWKSLASVAGAGAVIGCFFLLQKHIKGWYLYPEHTAMIQFTWLHFKGATRFILEWVLYAQLRVVVFAVLAVLSLATAIVQRNYRYALMAPLALLLVIEISDQVGEIPRKLLIPLVFGLFIYTFHMLVKVHKGLNKQAAKMVYLLVFAFITYHIFSAFNFLSARYLLTSIVFMIVLAAYAFDLFISQLGKWCYPIVVLVILISGGAEFCVSDEHGDTFIWAYDAMRVQQDVVDYMEQHHLQDKNITAVSYQDHVHLTNINTGALHGTDTFRHVSDVVDTSTEYIIWGNIERYTGKPVAPELWEKFEQVFARRRGQAWMQVLKSR